LRDIRTTTADAGFKTPRTASYKPRSGAISIWCASHPCRRASQILPARRTVPLQQIRWAVRYEAMNGKRWPFAVQALAFRPRPSTISVRLIGRCPKIIRVRFGPDRKGSIHAPGVRRGTTNNTPSASRPAPKLGNTLAPRGVSGPSATYNLRPPDQNRVAPECGTSSIWPDLLDTRPARDSRSTLRAHHRNEPFRVFCQTRTYHGPPLRPTRFWKTLSPPEPAIQFPRAGSFSLWLIVAISGIVWRFAQRKGLHTWLRWYLYSAGTPLSESTWRLELG